MMLHVEIVEISVRFHLSQHRINRFIVTNASQNTDQKEVTVEEADLVEIAVAEDLVEEVEEAVVDLEEIDLQERCTQLHVEIVEQNVKFHSNQVERNQFIVTSASLIIN